MNVMFEDEHLLCVNKEPGLSVQRDKTAGESMEARVRQRSSFVGIVHRIDKPVSGLVIFAKTKPALQRLNRSVQEGEIRKVYWAIVECEPPDREGELIHYLKKNGRINKSFASSTPVQGGKEARLSYSTIGGSERYRFLQVVPATGRHHQIRCQLGFVGCPVRGDVKYGARRTVTGGGIGLHARALAFAHPLTGEALSFTAAPPEDVLWELFSRTATDGPEPTSQPGSG